MITLLRSVGIDACRERVWRALTDTRELIAWDDRMLAPVGSPNGYPQAGETVRWRYRLGSVQVVLHEKPSEITCYERLTSSLRVGSLRFEQTYTLTGEPADPDKTRLGMKLVTDSSVPIIGEVLDRFHVQKLAAERIDETLDAVQRWCEQNR